MSILPHITTTPHTPSEAGTLARNVHVQLTWTIRRRRSEDGEVAVESVVASIHPHRLVLTTTDESGLSSHETVPIDIEMHLAPDGDDPAMSSSLTIDVKKRLGHGRFETIARLHRTANFQWLVRSDIPRILGFLGGTYRFEGVQDLTFER